LDPISASSLAKRIFRWTLTHQHAFGHLNLKLPTTLANPDMPLIKLLMVVEVDVDI
jgi:hypothetical protein